MLRQVRLLEISPRIGERVDKDEEDEAKQIGRAADVGDASQMLPPSGFSAARCFLAIVRSESLGKKRTHCAAISNIAAEMRRKTPVLRRLTSRVGTSASDNSA